MTKILGLSAKKQGGKDTTANWIIGEQMKEIGLVSYIKIDTYGRLIVPSVTNENEIQDGILDIRSREPEVIRMMEQCVWPVVKVYSFADTLKNMAINVFGLSYPQVYGTNDQKNEPTQYKWKQFDKFLSEKTRLNFSGRYEDNMTSRDILQVVGTDICREIYGDIWVNACINKIKRDGPELAVITDVRFPNEVEAVQNNNGKVIRFLRGPFANKDEHESETKLDNYENFDIILDNRNMTIEEQLNKTNEILKEWKYDVWNIDN